MQVRGTPLGMRPADPKRFADWLARPRCATRLKPGGLSCHSYTRNLLLLPGMNDAPANKRAQRAWCLYDWANSTFATSVVAAILPVYFARTAARNMPAHDATALWGYASAAALAVTALLSPLVGALADQSRRRKPLLLACVLLGSAGTLGLALAPAGTWSPLLVS